MKFGFVRGKDDRWKVIIITYSSEWHRFREAIDNAEREEEDCVWEGGDERSMMQITKKGKKITIQFDCFGDINIVEKKKKRNSRFLKNFLNEGG